VDAHHHDCRRESCYSASVAAMQHASFADAWAVRRLCEITRLMAGLMLTRLDYCNAVLADLPSGVSSTDCNRSSTLLLALSCQAAEVTISLRCSWIFTAWLRVPERIEFKLSNCVLWRTTASIQHLRVSLTASSGIWHWDPKTTSLGSYWRLWDDSSPAFDVARRRFVP